MNKSMVIAAVAGGLTAIAVSMAQDAHADESSYLNEVSARGVPITSATLTLGHQICSDISYYGVDGIEKDARAAVVAGVSAHDAAVLIVVAVYELCPSNHGALNAWLYPTTEA
jgi:hypothetical protein